LPDEYLKEPQSETGVQKLPVYEIFATGPRADTVCVAEE